ncbi:MAG: hypothetical protein KGL38_12375, partial [Gemmatimonadota bacterium]|nr:hypothetical protein [Gemmatimonadota bacterium]
MKARRATGRVARLAFAPLGRLTLAAVLAAAALGSTARRAVAQDAGNGFLFGAPKNSLTIRTGYDIASAASDVFATVMQELTLKKSDFSSPTIATDFGFRISPQVDGVL